jgi:hypothetical protein
MAISIPRRDVRVVDVSDRPAKVNVVREGFQVPPPAINEQRVAGFLEDLIQLPPQQTPRVVSQSIPAGTKVTAGTVIDLVLAPKQVIPWDIFENVHAGVAGLFLPAADAALNNTQARQILLKYEDPADVPAAERTVLTNALQGTPLQVDAQDPARNFDRAFSTGRNALTFR